MAATFASGPYQSASYSIQYTPRWVGQTYAADLNADGNDDLVVLGATYPSDGAASNAVAQPGLVAFGNGGGGFTVATSAQFPITALTTLHPREVVFADFNADGHLDVFIADHGYDANPFPGAQNRLFLSNGNGTWRDATSNLPSLADFTHSASAADVDRDGDLDIVVGNTPLPNPTRPYLLLNDGAGMFARANTLPTAPGQPLNEHELRILSTLLADLDGDGQVDLIAGAGFSTAQQPETAQVFWGQDGSFPGIASALPLPAFFGAQHSVYDIQAIDVNYDGMLDLLLSYQKDLWLGGWETQVLVNQGNRSFVDQTAAYIPEAAARNGGTPTSSSAESQYWVQFLHPRDVNRDGRMDFVVDARGSTSAPSTMPVVYVQQADGSFDAVTVGEITTTLRWMFDYTTQFVKWNGGSGFVHFGFHNGSVEIQTLPVTFGASARVTQNFTQPVRAVGTLFDDHLYGGLGADTFIGHGGNDIISGGSGRDTAVYAASRSSYQVTTSQGVTTVRGSGEGTDTLSGIERIVFDDRAIAFDMAGHAGVVARIIGAVFGPSIVASQPAYVGIGLQLADAGRSYVELMQLALNVRFGDQPPSNESVVRLLYENVIGATPSASEVGEFAAMISSGQFTQASIGVFAAETVYNANRIGLVGLAATGLDYIPA